ncbi:MAG: hypothetical protein M1828_005871 [Chrysothrix sp. TS-e1954]|nr:MAG: hypothetical protein M1828_005871 [Chrysothrix sp. TS-e1954]
MGWGMPTPSMVEQAVDYLHALGAAGFDGARRYWADLRISDGIPTRHRGQPFGRMGGGPRASITVIAEDNAAEADVDWNEVNYGAYAEPSALDDPWQWP